MLTFSGFNGFGQFGDEHGARIKTFKTISVDNRLPTESRLLISCSWNYTAYAAGRTILLKGFLNDEPGASFIITAETNVQAIAACERLCLVLLDNGKLCKVTPSKGTKLEEINLMREPTAPKRTIFGDRKLVESLKISHIAIGTHIAAAVSTTNAVFSIPSQIHQFPSHFRVRQLECGFEHALLLTSNGDVYSWGNGLRGQLGIEALQIEETPILIEALAGIKITFIAAGGWHSAAISAFGDLYTWGFNSNGQLGLRLFKSSALKEPAVYPLPQLLDLPSCYVDADEEDSNEIEKCTPIAVMAGARHTVVTMSCGTLLVVGWNKHGQLGLTLEDNSIQCDKFTKVNLTEEFRQDSVVICGAWSTVVIKNNKKK